MRLDLTGKRFGYLTVLRKTSKRSKSGCVIWECLCDCGNVVELPTKYLNSGQQKSCGCMHFEACKTHGMADTRLYHIWCTMKARCNRTTNPKYNRYGGRGITMCEEWQNNFSAFYEWATAHGYKDGLSIDRIDNDGDYCPENCKWSTAKEQANNTSKTKHYEYRGEIYTAYELSQISNLSPKLINRRIRRGWSVKKAVETPKITTFFGSTGRK